MVKTISAIVVGAILGVVGARYLFVGSGLSLIPWAIAGIALGYWGGWRQGILHGAAYGFALAFVFMISGYSGNASLISRLPFFALLGLVGAACGSVLGLIGGLGRKFALGRKSR